MDHAERGFRIRTAYGIFLAAFTVVFGALFLIAVSEIYFAGTETAMYSREIVGAHLRRLAVPAILWAIAVALGFVVTVLLPARERRKSPDARRAYRRLRRRMPSGESAEFLAARAELKKTELLRGIAWGVCAAFGMIAAIVSAVYLFNAAHFTAADPKAEIKAVIIHVVPWIGAAFLLCCGAVILESALAGRELAQMKRLLVLGRGAPVAAQSPAALKKTREILASERFIFAMRLVVLALGLTFFILGIVNGGQQDVLFKAINICTECIGLG